MNSDTTIVDPATAANRAAFAEEHNARRASMKAKVLAVIARRAKDAKLSDADYFREIIAGRAPRITQDEAMREPLPPRA